MRCLRIPAFGSWAPAEAAEEASRGDSRQRDLGDHRRTCSIGSEDIEVAQDAVSADLEHRAQAGQLPGGDLGPIEDLLGSRHRPMLMEEGVDCFVACARAHAVGCHVLQEARRCGPSRTFGEHAPIELTEQAGNDVGVVFVASA